MSVFWKRDYQSTQTSAKLYHECQNVGNCNYFGKCYNTLGINIMLSIAFQL